MPADRSEERTPPPAAGAPGGGDRRRSRRRSRRGDRRQPHPVGGQEAARRPAEIATDERAIEAKEVLPVAFLAAAVDVADAVRTSESEDVPRGPLVHVTFRGGRVEAFANDRQVEVRPGDHLIVEAERGVDLGRVVACAAPHQKRRRNGPIRALLRQATQEEVQRLTTLVQEDAGALEICRGRAAHFKLEMKVIDAETQFDGNRVTFYFTADHRVDFRELVRDLASIFRTRIELRQVGARDAARRCDGMGMCGRTLCCNTFLREFEPVTLKMAKEQNLSLNPTKISGVCGRLMCCLTYEFSAYHMAAKQTPAIGSRWRIDGHTFTVRLRDVGNHRVFLEDEAGKLQEIDLDRLAEAEPEPAPREEGAPAGPVPAGEPEGAAEAEPAGAPEPARSERAPGGPARPGRRGRRRASPEAGSRR